MATSNSPEKSSGKPLTLEEEISKVTEKLLKLQNKQKEFQRKENERRQKAVFDLIKIERLDIVPIEAWRSALPEIRRLFGLEKT